MTPRASNLSFHADRYAACELIVMPHSSLPTESHIKKKAIASSLLFLSVIGSLVAFLLAHRLGANLDLIVLVAACDKEENKRFGKRGPGKKGPEYRYLATREELKQTELPGMEKSDAGYCFPVMRIQNQRYKVFGIVTTMDWAGDMLIPWLHQR